MEFDKNFIGRENKDSLKWKRRKGKANGHNANKRNLRQLAQGIFAPTMTYIVLLFL